MTYTNNYGSGYRHYYIPPNTMDSIYLSKLCNKFSSCRFDEPLAQGKITKYEVD